MATTITRLGFTEKALEASDIPHILPSWVLIQNLWRCWELFKGSLSPKTFLRWLGTSQMYQSTTKHHLGLKHSTQCQSKLAVWTTIPHYSSQNEVCLNLLQISSFRYSSYKSRAWTIITIFQNLSNATKNPVQTPRSPLKVRMWTLIFTPSRTQRWSSPSGLPSWTTTERQHHQSSTKYIYIYDT